VVASEMEVAEAPAGLRRRLGAGLRMLRAALLMRAARLSLRPLLWTTLALSFLLVCDLILFRSAILDGEIYYRSDTVTYYFPIAYRLRDVLHQGRILLWTRYLFGGFPLFADGEAGMLYPPNLLAYLAMPADQAFIWLRVARYFMAAAFTFFYLRTLRLNRLAATAGALTFAFGSFMVGQMHHTNVGNTAVWLPLTLALIETGLGSHGRRRWLYFTGAGVSTGVQALGLHIQPLIMSGFLLALYIPYRVLLGPPRPVTADRRAAQRNGPDLSHVDAKAEPADEVVPAAVIGGADAQEPALGWADGLGARAEWLKVARTRLAARARMAEWRGGMRGIGGATRWVASRSPAFLAAGARRVALALAILCLIPAIAFGLSAVQIIPLVELGMFSFRGTGVSYQFATSFSLPVHNLINLILPYFFRYTNPQYYWALWSEWETTIYFGIGGLVLAGIAVLFVRDRMVLFFTVIATASLLLAFGSYSPVPVYEWVWRLPGFSSLRVPGRFTMLVTFSAAVLAAYGMDWLCRTLRPSDGPPPEGRWARLARVAGVHGFALYLMALLVGMAGVAWWLFGFRVWIEKDPASVKRLVEQSYLALRNDKPWLNSDMVLNFLTYTLDPANQKTATSFGIMLAILLLLFAWFAFRRLWRIWATMMVGLVAADLLLFALDFHPTLQISQLATPSPAARWLMEQNGDGMLRIYSAKEVRKTEPNRLLPYQIADIDGYSSLETVRHQQFMAKLREFDLPLLDLYGVRFVIFPRQPTALPSFELTAYNPNHPLADGPRTNPGAHVTFYVNPAVNADEVAFISNLRDSEGIPQDAEVADIVVVDTSGERVTLKVRAGRETADWSWDKPGSTVRIAHRRAIVADNVWTVDSIGIRYRANLYYGRVPLDRKRTISRVEFHYTYPSGAVRLYGMMLWERPSSAHQLLAVDRFIPRYQDADLQIRENPSRLPRALLVPTARIAERRTILDTMASGDFDPARVVLLETPTRQGSPLPPSLLPSDGAVVDPHGLEPWLASGPDGSTGAAEIALDRSTEVEVRTRSGRPTFLLLTDSFHPGWKALVDGEPAPIYRADYLFRAVPVPAGEHVVRFVYQPESFELGSRLSAFTAATVVIVWAVLLSGAWERVVALWRRRAG